MKCHKCFKELVPSKSPKWTLSCPSTHGHIYTWKNKDGEFTTYRFYLYPSKEIRYTIEQSHYYGSYKLHLTKHTKLPNLIKNKKGQMVKRGTVKKRDLLLKLEKQIPITISNDGILEVQKLFDKLQLYVLFS